MDKKQLEDLLARYQQGIATPHQKSMVEAYMLMAEKEQPDFFEAEKVVIGKRLWSKINPGKIVGLKTGKPSLVRSLYVRSIKIAAACILLIGLAVIAYLMRYPLLDIVSPVALNTIRTGPYETKQVMLPDSSLITLAPNSSISYPVTYRGHKRMASLTGMAFFKIKRDITSPFNIKSKELDVDVLGTSFVVDDAAGNKEAMVTVVSGKVKVSRQNNELAILTVGQQAKYNKSQHQLTVLHNMDVASATLWTGKQFVFNETSLQTVLNSLQLFYGRKIEIQANLLSSGITFTGSFAKDEKLPGVLDVICYSLALRYSVAKDSTIQIIK